MKIYADTLSNYLKKTLENHIEHSNSEPPLMCMLHEMDEAFHNEIFAHDYDATASSTLLTMNAYMMFCNAVHQALSGHAVAVFPVARAALESACYAFLCSDKKLALIWLNRDNSNTTKDKCRKAFTVNATVEKLKHISIDIAAYVMALYDISIKYGAHPNIKAISPHLKRSNPSDDKVYKLQHASLYKANSDYVISSLEFCLDMGIVIIFLLAASAKEHPFLTENIENFHNLITEKNKIIAEINQQDS